MQRAETTKSKPHKDTTDQAKSSFAKSGIPTATSHFESLKEMAPEPRCTRFDWNMMRPEWTSYSASDSTASANTMASSVPV